MRRAPGFSAVVVATLALGIGLNTAAFGAVYALLLRPLAGVERPDRLVQIYRSWPGIAFGPNSIPHFEDLRARGGEVFDGVAAWSFVTVGLGAEDGGDVVTGQMVSADFFDVLGVGAALGRFFVPAEVEVEGGRPELVLGHDFWRGRFGADPRVVGRAIRINGVPFEVVGVAPAGFKGAVDIYAPAFWAPLSAQPLLQPGREGRAENRNSNFMQVVARLRDGVTIEATRAGVAALFEGLVRDHPEAYEGSDIRLVPQDEAGIRPSWGDAPRRFATLLMAVAGLLLLLACANVANLLLSRAEQRRREIGLRLSIGAGRGRILRQLLTEGVVLALVSGAAGVGLASLAVRVMNGLHPPTELPLSIDFSLSLPVLAFTVATALATTLVFALVPALHASRATATGGLARLAGRGRRTSRTTAVLVVAQTALALVLLLSGGVFLRSLRAATAIAPGFDAGHVLLARVSPDLLGWDRTATEAFAVRVAERMAAEPGVASVSWADVLPLGASDQSTRVAVPGRDPASEEPMSLGFARIGPGYFVTMGIRLVRGRGVEAADDENAEGVVVVNQTMAERLWPGLDPVGRYVETQGRLRRVVGVAADAKYGALDEAPTPFFYMALAQDFRAGITLLVRTGGEPSAWASTLRSTIREVAPTVPLRELGTLEGHLGTALFTSRLAAGGLGVFAILGVALAVLGIYGVVAHTVSRETREIGIRVALGAEPTGVSGMVLVRSGRLALVGVAVGLVLAALVVTAVRSLLYTPHAVDPVAFVTLPPVLLVAALLASWIPARRAARIDPAVVLKET
jgi:predicted permease